MTETSARRAPLETDRNMAMVGYGLLFASIFFAGVPGLIAVIIAYSQRDRVEPSLRRHHDFQIRIFWVALALSIVAAGCALAAIIAGIGDLMAFGAQGGWQSVEDGTIDLADVHVDASVVALIVTALIASFITALWLVAAPAVGFIRLANQRLAGEGAA